MTFGQFRTLESSTAPMRSCRLSLQLSKQRDFAFEPVFYPDHVTHSQKVLFFQANVSAFYSTQQEPP